MMWVLSSLLTLVVLQSATSEEPFCGNKCYGSGVSMRKKCHCDQECSYLFNDCCGDYEFLMISNGDGRGKRAQNLSCERISGDKYSLIKNSCPTDWQGPDLIRTSCESSNISLTDPFAATPITNPANGITYGNYFCAICNDDAGTMMFWNIQVSCPSLRSNVGMNSRQVSKFIFYNEQETKWGFLFRNPSTGSETFHGCDITHVPPQYLASKVRPCEPEINTCHPSWKQNVIREMCGTYSDPVYANNVRYKNFYCAMCNRVDQSELSCGTAVGPRTDMKPEVTSQSPNFALIIDIDLSDGNGVGSRAPCNEGLIYDPFVKVCRNIVCGLPGHHMEKGKCTKTES